jgi:hypothetical protein
MLRPLFLKAAGHSMVLTTTLRSLSKAAKRKRVGVADVIYESVESFVAKCEAEAELETKIIKFRRG